ncbi:MULTISPECIES: hypothetical protein [unclassified Rhizobium]|uniref:hypothetical protein n=1 Tax=unclassified Rhizobium TaxID=2613769 RepID=UPI00131A5695|nr:MULTISPECIES: hypothetical protein [Rhizobium]UWU22919.1 hypothetical protein N2601_08240 [Rhizobium tropici]
MKKEQQLSMLLPISNARLNNASLIVDERASKGLSATSDKRHVQIKESLKNKGLLKSSRS